MTELIITGVNIFILSFCLGYFLSPMIIKMLKTRRAGIANDLLQARQKREDARQDVQLYEHKMINFDQERQDVLTRAKEKASAREAQMLAAAESEARIIIDRADREAALMRAKLKDEVRREMVSWGTAAASRLIMDNMDEAVQDEMIQETLKEMGEETWQS